MAYTLKTTGIAAKLIACLGVDDDGTTVKDFVSGNSGTYDASIGSPKTGAGSWKGTTISWFKTDQGADQYAPRGWSWSSTISVPMGGGGNGVTFLALAHSVNTSGAGVLWLTSDNNQGGRKTASPEKMEVLCGNTPRGTGTTTIPTSTKVAFGFKQIYNTSSLPLYYGLESGSLATDGTYNEGGYASTSNLSMFGGHTGYGSCNGQWYFALWFSHATPPTTAELQALHNDPLGTLFDLPITGTFAATLSPVTVSATGTHITPITGTFSATLSPVVMAATGTVNVPVKRLIFSGLTLLEDETQTPITLSNVGYAWYDSTNVTALGTVKDYGTFNLSSGAGTITLSATSLVSGQTGTLFLKGVTSETIPRTFKAYIEMAIT